MVWKGWEKFDPGERAMLMTPAAPKRAKYNAVRTTTADGITHDSNSEAMRWLVLKEMQSREEIAELRRQVPFDLTTLPRDQRDAAYKGFVTVGTYVADFVYLQNGVMVVEDVKGLPTRMYQWKRKHMRLEYGIAIKET